MDPITFIKSYVPKGAIIFINYRFSLTVHFNPSEDKHAAIYIGNLQSNCLRDGSTCALEPIDDDCYAIEASYKNGVRMINIKELLKDAKSIKILVLHDIISDIKMAIAADIAITFIGTPYGFGKHHLYCFKLVADCYSHIGIIIPTFNILGKRIYLSQSFDNDQWKKIYNNYDI
ncbi:hypothetical protein [Swinepox virus]|uniref:Protein OPG091 n=1 Tax=Swinepox virus TaxID=10276 RepID=A0A881SY04_SWPV|nr:hypothetical protein [Swinepox virus]